MRVPIAFCLVGLAVAGAAAADELVLPIFALNWPGKDGNVWSSEVFLVNPGPATAIVSNPHFVPGTLREPNPCYPPIAAFHEVAPYSTVMLSSADLSIELQCPQAALGGLAFDADPPVVITSRVANVRGGAAAGATLAGLGQDLSAFGPADLSVPGAIYQLPALVFDSFRCARAPLFEVYLYLANPGSSPVGVTLQRSHDGSAGALILDGAPQATPFTFTLPAQGWRQIKVDLGGASPSGCGSPQVADLFFTATGGVAVVASVVDRTSQDARTVLPVRTVD